MGVLVELSKLACKEWDEEVISMMKRAQNQGRRDCIVGLICFCL